MSKVTIPINEVKTTGSLFALYYNSTLRDDISKSITATEAIAEGVFNLSIDEVLSILTALGKVEGYLMAIRAPKTGLAVDVPEGLPNNKKFDGTAKSIENWFDSSVEIWQNPPQDEIIFYTSIFGGNENTYLTGAEIKILHDMASVTAITIEEAKAEVATGWTKL